MDITDIRMKVMDNGSRMKAVASLTICGCFAVHDIKVIEGDKGLFIAMPSKKGDDGTYRDVCHPINGETRQQIEDAIIQKYHQVIAEETVASE